MMDSTAELHLGYASLGGHGVRPSLDDENLMGHSTGANPCARQIHTAEMSTLPLP